MYVDKNFMQSGEILEMLSLLIITRAVKPHSTAKHSSFINFLSLLHSVIISAIVLASLSFMNRILWSRFVFAFSWITNKCRSQIRPPSLRMTIFCCDTNDSWIPSYILYLFLFTPVLTLWHSKYAYATSMYTYIQQKMLICM